MRQVVFWAKVVTCFIWISVVSIVAPLFLLLAHSRHEFLARLVALWSRGVLKISGIRVQIEGDKIPDDRAVILMANHQSGLDILVFSKVTPRRATIVGKRELQWIPIIGWIMKLSGAILINRSDRESAIMQLREAIHTVAKHKLAVAYTPEGTRNPQGEKLLPFKKGGFQMAIAGHFPIVPVVCSPLKNIVSFKERKFGPGTLRLCVLKPIKTEGLTPEDLTSLMESVRNVMVKTFAGLSQGNFFLH